MKEYIIRLFGLKGSWKWAKKQMMNGEIVRCKHWAGALKLTIDTPFNGRLMSNFTRTPININDQPLWDNAVHHISYEEFTDYVIFKWED